MIKIIPFHLLKWFRSKYFTKNFLGIFFVLCIPFSVLIFLTYQTSVREINSNIMQSNEKMIATAGETMDNFLSLASSAGYFLSTMAQVEEFCYFGTVYQSAADSQRITDAIKFAENSNKSFDSIWVYSDRLQRFFNWEANIRTETLEQNEAWVQSLIVENGDKSKFLYSTKYNIYPELLSFYIPVIANNQVVGCVLINLNVENINEILNFTEENTFLVWQDDVLLYSDDKEYFSPEYAQNRQMLRELTVLMPFSGEQDLQNSNLYTTVSSSTKGINYMLITDMSYYYSQYNDVILLFIPYVIMAVLASFLLSAWVAVRTSEPIWRMLNSISSKNDESEQQVQNNDIVEKIIGAIRESDSLNELLSAKMRLLESSQLIALQTQINPHFLYNTLETVKWNAMELTKSANPVSKTIQNLGKLLRYSLTMTPPFTTLAEEQRNIELYLTIANVRFENKINIVWHCEEDTLDCKMPRLLLQPVIENCISHGLRYIQNTRYIQVFSKMEKDYLRLSIWDNGIGIAPDALEVLNERIRNMDVFADRHIGLLNVAQRIKLTYGENSSMVVVSEQDAGTEVVLKLYDAVLEKQKVDDHPVFGV